MPLNTVETINKNNMFYKNKIDLKRKYLLA